MSVLMQDLIEPWWKQLRSLALKGRRFESAREIEEALWVALAYWRMRIATGRDTTKGRRSGDLERGAIVVRSDETHRTKTGEERTVYVSPEAQAILRRIAEERGTADDTFVFQGPRSDRLSYEVTSRYFHKYRELAKLSNTLTFHSLRMASAGVPLRTIQKMLGHSDITITARTCADVMTDAARRQVQAAFE